MFYHVSAIDHPIGAVVRPGRHGEQYRQFRPGGPMPTRENVASVMWEIALEAARVAISEELPSRLSCVFVWDDKNAAAAFRDRFRIGRPILKVEPIGDLGRLHRADCDILDKVRQSAYAEYMAEGAKAYWTMNPVGAAEVLLAQPVLVIGACE